VFLVLASDHLREYSLQEPSDLRIRRRKSELPEVEFNLAFQASVNNFINKVEAAQAITGVPSRKAWAHLQSVTDLGVKPSVLQYDAAVTSPPYAMALPYIDTQRLSLIWLDLTAADNIALLESDLIGSREFRGQARKASTEILLDNRHAVPVEQHGLCVELYNNLAAGDGFRRQQVPSLLYRYFSNMQSAFLSVGSMMRRQAPFALVVGHNHTTIGGERYDIDTPTHLASIACNAGWEVEEKVPLQTYRRYGLHSENAVAAETLLVLRKN
jgi:site-specific DNA-methyltransferase (cytosine-N4-specific)